MNCEWNLTICGDYWLIKKRIKQREKGLISRPLFQPFLDRLGASVYIFNNLDWVLAFLGIQLEYLCLFNFKTLATLKMLVKKLWKSTHSAGSNIEQHSTIYRKIIILYTAQKQGKGNTWSLQCKLVQIKVTIGAMQTAKKRSLRVLHVVAIQTIQIQSVCSGMTSSLVRPSIKVRKNLKQKTKTWIREMHC